MLAEPQEAGQILDEEQLAFLADPGIPDGKAAQTTIPNTAAFQIEDLDAYDFDCDDVSNAKAVLMANLSNYDNEITSDGNIILYSQYLQETQQEAVQDTNFVISSQHVASPVIDDEDTLILEEVSRSKMLAKQNDPMFKEKKVNQTPINYVELNRLSKDFVKIEAPQELPKVSLVNTSLKKLKYHLTQFDIVAKKQITPDAITEGEWGFKHTKAIFLKEIIPFVKTLKDIFNVFDKDLLNEVVQIVLWYLDSGCSKHMTENRSQLMNFISKFLGTVRFGNDQVAKIIGYGDYQLGNVIVSRVYYVEGLGHNLFFVGQFCDADLEVTFRKSTSFIRHLEGVDLLSGSRDTNLYTISLEDMLKTSPICLL
ncbi:hypothetical protein Tco_0944376 [Tanacetum coccineum]